MSEEGNPNTQKKEEALKMADGFDDLRELAQKQATRKKLKNKAEDAKASVPDKLDYIIALLEE